MQSYPMISCPSRPRNCTGVLRRFAAIWALAMHEVWVNPVNSTVPTWICAPNCETWKISFTDAATNATRNVSLTIMRCEVRCSGRVSSAQCEARESLKCWKRQAQRHNCEHPQMLMVCEILWDFNSNSYHYLKNFSIKVNRKPSLSHVSST